MIRKYFLGFFFYSKKHYPWRFLVLVFLDKVSDSEAFLQSLLAGSRVHSVLLFIVLCGEIKRRILQNLSNPYWKEQPFWWADWIQALLATRLLYAVFGCSFSYGCICKSHHPATMNVPLFFNLDNKNNPVVSHCLLYTLPDLTCLSKCPVFPKCFVGHVI